jgi:hypothetical protein
MANGVRIRGVSGDVSNVSVQSSVNRTWALLGRKWAGLRWKVHDLALQRDEVLVLKCQGGACVLELTSTGNEHGDTIAQEDVSRIRLHPAQARQFTLRQGQSLVLTTPSIQHPWRRIGPIIET